MASHCAVPGSSGSGNLAAISWKRARASSGWFARCNMLIIICGEPWRRCGRMATASLGESSTSACSMPGDSARSLSARTSVSMESNSLRERAGSRSFSACAACRRNSGARDLGASAAFCSARATACATIDSAAEAAPTTARAVKSKRDVAIGISCAGVYQSLSVVFFFTGGTESRFTGAFLGSGASIVFSIASNCSRRSSCTGLGGSSTATPRR